MRCLNTVPSKIFFLKDISHYWYSESRNKGGDSHDHSGRLTFVPLCPCYQPTLIVSWRARRFETCRLHFLFLLRTENLTQKRQLVTFSAQFSRSKNADKLDNLQVNTWTVQSTEVDPNQTGSLDLKDPAFHWCLGPDPKISVSPIVYKGMKQTHTQITFLFFFLLKLWRCLTMKPSTEHHFSCFSPAGWLLTVEGKHRSFEARPVKNQRFE